MIFQLFFLYLVSLGSFTAAFCQDLPPVHEITEENSSETASIDQSKRPVLSENRSVLGHIFRNELGHFTHDTQENRQHLLDATQDPKNSVGFNKFDVEIFFKKLSDGTQIWAFVEKGRITDGGFNRFPKKWVEDPNQFLGGNIVSAKYHDQEPTATDCKASAQFNKLNTFYSSYYDPKPILERIRQGRMAQGVENQTGVILNMFDDMSLLYPNEHIFFMPTPEGLLLEEREVQQIISELATGVLFHETIPFFSLHFNRNLAQYPIIHPAYQSTLVGEVISMVDFYMKGFVNGLYFDEGFIREWEKNPSMDKKFLKEKSIDLKRYCQEYLQIPYFTFEEIRQSLLAELPESTGNAGLCARSFRLIAKQDAMKRAENLYVIDGDFDIFLFIGVS